MAQPFEMVTITTTNEPLTQPFEMMTMATTNKPLTEFTVFLNLPIGLRKKIFGFIETPYTETHVHAIRGFPEHILKDKVRNPEQNSIEPSPPSQLQWPNADYEWPKGTAIAYFTWNLQGGRFFSTTAPRIPPLLHTCKESRQYFIEKHNLVHAFGSLFNLDRDILFLDASTAIHYAEVNNPGVEAFAELLRHPELIGKIKRIAFHAAVHDYLWLTKYAEKMKGLLTSLEEMYLVWGADGGPRTVQKTIPKLTGQSLLFLDVTQQGFDKEHLSAFPLSKLKFWQDDMKRDMDLKWIVEQRWINAIPDHKPPKKEVKRSNKKNKLTEDNVKLPKFRHVFAKNAAFGHDHGVVEYQEWVDSQPVQVVSPSKRKRKSSAGNSLQRVAVKNAAMKKPRY